MRFRRKIATANVSARVHSAAIQGLTRRPTLRREATISARFFFLRLYFPFPRIWCRELELFPTKPLIGRDAHWTLLWYTFSTHLRYLHKRTVRFLCIHEKQDCFRVHEKRNCCFVACATPWRFAFVLYARSWLPWPLRPRFAPITQLSSSFSGTHRPSPFLHRDSPAARGRTHYPAITLDSADFSARCLRCTLSYVSLLLVGPPLPTLHSKRTMGFGRSVLPRFASNQHDHLSLIRSDLVL